jgi:3-oxoacyl-[acyl-carrier protein] reductase
MDLNLDGKRALITGSTKGLGRAIAEVMAAEGVDVGICGRDASRVEETCREIAAKYGVKAYGSPVDVGDHASLRAWVEEMVGLLGGLDIVVSNVSAGGGGRTSLEAWKENFELDMLVPVVLVDATVPHLEKAKGGSILMISSTAAVETFRGPQPYNAMKAAIINYAKNLSQVLATSGIRVNTISPGPILMPGGAWERISRDNPPLYEGTVSQIPIGRMGSGVEVASACTYLCSPLAGYITGSNLIIDGGFTKRVNF